MVTVNVLRGDARISTGDGQRFDAKIIGVSNISGVDFLQLEGHESISLKKIAVISLPGMTLVGPALTVDGLREATYDEIDDLLEQHRDNGPLLPSRLVVVEYYEGLLESEDEDDVPEDGYNEIPVDDDGVPVGTMGLIEVPDGTPVVVLKESNGGWVETPEGSDEQDDEEAPVPEESENGFGQAGVSGSVESDPDSEIPGSVEEIKPEAGFEVPGVIEGVESEDEELLAMIEADQTPDSTPDVTPGDAIQPGEDGSGKVSRKRRPR